MPWCPICKNEYVDGVTECSDCKVPLVDSLEKVKIPVIIGTQEEIERLYAFLEYSRFKDLKLNHNEETDEYELFCNEKDEKKIRRASTIFYQQETLRKSSQKQEAEWEQTQTSTEEQPASDLYSESASDELDAAEDAEPLYEEENESEKSSSTKSVSSKPYRKKSEKAADFKSSGYTLIPVGMIGILVLFGIELGWIPIQLAAPGKYLTYTVMGGLFFIFMIVGFYSLHASKKYELDANEEEAFITQLKQWVQDHIDAASILHVIFQNASDTQEELLYFKVTEIVRHMITEEFDNLDESFLDDFIDSIYHDLFEELIAEHFHGEA